MSSNFLQFNPPGNNQESDPTYLADGTRTAGFVIDQIVPSPLMNKAWYQWSIFVAAFAQMMANKGFVMSDANFANLVTALTNVVTTADLKGSLTTVSYATAVTFDAALANGFYIKLTGNVSTTALTNQSTGILLFIIQQDATGGRTMPWPSSISFTTTPICPQPNSFTLMQVAVLPDAQIIPIGPICWISASGVLIPPNPSSIVQLSASGNISNQFSDTTEEVNSSGGAVTRNLYTASGYAGFKVTVKNLGPTLNNVTLQCLVGGQTIDGFPNVAIGPYSATTVQSDGTNWIIVSSATIGAAVTKSQTFLTSGTFNPSTALLELGGWVQVFIVGGGGGGGGLPNGGSGGGGGSVVGPTWVQISGPVTVTIASGGAVASVGGNSTFGSLLTALGGSPGTSGYGGASGASVSSSGGGYSGDGGGAGAGGAGWTNAVSGAGIGGPGGPGLFGYAGGGAGGTGGVIAPGSNGGGGSGENGQANTGGGGGSGANGGSGICILVWQE